MPLLSPRLRPLFGFASLAVVALGAIASCGDLDSGGWTAPECREDADCPSEKVCHLFACVDPSSLDGGPASDAGSPDGGAPPDGGSPDDAGTPDDGGAPDDGGLDDAGSDDAGMDDAGPEDAGQPDGGAVTVLAPPGAATVDGIQCLGTEHLEYHIHAHLQVYAEGVQRLIPGNVGIGTLDGGGACYSFLHTHDLSGILHIESPTVTTYSLGQFFAVWGLPLSATQVGPATGAVTAYVNGELFTGDITTIPLTAYAVIQLDVGTPVVPPQPYTFPGGL